MDKTLEQRLKGQVVIAWWQLGLSVAWMIGLIFTRSMNFDYFDSSSSHIHVSFMSVVMTFLAAAAGISLFVLWIIGIVKAIKINQMTGSRNGTLVIFSIFILFFAHLLVANSVKQKELPNASVIDENTTKQNVGSLSKQQKLKNLDKAFHDGVISAAEYKAKKSEIK